MGTRENEARQEEMARDREDEGQRQGLVAKMDKEFTGKNKKCLGKVSEPARDTRTASVVWILHVSGRVQE